VGGLKDGKQEEKKNRELPNLKSFLSGDVFLCVFAMAGANLLMCISPTKE
jgi:hypothetical protein